MIYLYHRSSMQDVDNIAVDIDKVKAVVDWKILPSWSQNAPRQYKIIYIYIYIHSLVYNESKEWNNVLTYILGTVHDVCCTLPLAHPCGTHGRESFTVCLYDYVRRNEAHIYHVSMYMNNTIYLKRQDIFLR